jgi:hypothetical protein
LPQPQWLTGNSRKDNREILLGHKDFKMTLRYAHLAQAHKVAALSLLDSTPNQDPTIQKLYSPMKKGLTVADNDIYCLLDMDNSSGGRRWPTPAGTSLEWGVKHAGINAERKYCMSQVRAQDRPANQRVRNTRWSRAALRKVLA